MESFEIIRNYADGNKMRYEVNHYEDAKFITLFFGSYNIDFECKEDYLTILYCNTEIEPDWQYGLETCNELNLKSLRLKFYIDVNFKLAAETFININTRRDLEFILEIISEQMDDAISLMKKLDDGKCEEEEDIPF